MGGGREVVVTGVGLVSSLGEGIDVHLAALDSPPAPTIDATTFAPFAVHPAPAIDWSRQIAKKAELRQMEAWQKLGVYAAGLALDQAGVKGDKGVLGRLDLIVAAGGGERDYAVDAQILSGLATSGDPGAFLNERLMNDIRPTLFLAQLSNLLAGNISIVHGVTGATRTFMGEEQAGVDALRVAAARISADQGDIFLVGGSYNAQRPDILLVYEMGGVLWKAPFDTVWERPHKGGGFVPGSGAAFLVVEAREHAERRNAPRLARIAGVAARQSRRAPGSVAEAIEDLWRRAAADGGARQAVISGATGLAPLTQEEAAALAKLAPRARLCATGDLFGHLIEAQFPAGVGLAAAAIAHGAADTAVVTSVGHMRGEGLAYLTRAE